jgi:hypothetical protein
LAITDNELSPVVAKRPSQRQHGHKIVVALARVDVASSLPEQLMQI